jgi:antitoxin MazE
MHSKVQRWGNSLAVRIPKAFALDVGLAEPSLTLEGLLVRITDENLHQEVETGPAVGNEVW